MAKRIYIANLPFSADDEALESAVHEVLGAFGTVLTAKLIFEGSRMRPRGLCFAEMSTDDEARTAISALNGLDVAGNALQVGEARPQLCPLKRRSRSGRRRESRRKKSNGSSSEEAPIAP